MVGSFGAGLALPCGWVLAPGVDLWGVAVTSVGDVAHWHGSVTWIQRRWGSSGWRFLVLPRVADVAMASGVGVVGWFGGDVVVG